MTDNEMRVSDEFAALPSYATEFLETSTIEEIVALMMKDEDRVPRNVIDTCAARAAEFLLIAEQLLDDSRLWSDDDIPDGAWWMKSHAVMILGLIPSQKAGELLLRFLRQIAEHNDYDLQDNLATSWSGLFANKPTSIGAAARTIANDATCDWYLRVTAFEIVLACALREGEAALDAALDWLAEHLATSDGDDDVYDFRAVLAAQLLDFPRERHKALLQALQRQQGAFQEFSLEDIENALARGTDTPEWEHFPDPWQCYEPEEIIARLQRWHEDAELNDDLLDFPSYAGDYGGYAEPFVRPTPKLGRNEPCHCGSGKKYKKCHLASDS